jgi:hypothetical protein
VRQSDAALHCIIQRSIIQLAGETIVDLSAVIRIAIKHSLQQCLPAACTAAPDVVQAALATAAAATCCLLADVICIMFRLVVRCGLCIAVRIMKALLTATTSANARQKSLQETIMKDVRHRGFDRWRRLRELLLSVAVVDRTCSMNSTDTDSRAKVR